MTKDDAVILVRSKLNPRFNFLLRSEFYAELIDEVIIKTIQAIQDENSKLSEKELPKIKK